MKKMARTATCNKCNHQFRCPKRLHEEYDKFTENIPDEKRAKAKIMFLVHPEWCPECRQKYPELGKDTVE
jgi:galactose-1-phosphate uridylyltransferase